MSQKFDISDVPSDGAKLNPVFYDLKPKDESKGKIVEPAKLGKDISPAFNLFVLTSYILSDIQKKPRSYRIGVFTITLTITFIIVLYCILDVLPVVFLKLAQNQAGESDFIYTAQSSSNQSYSGDNFMYNVGAYESRESLNDFVFPLINGTEFFEKTQNASDFEGFTSRWFGVAEFANTSNSDLYTSGLIMVLDTEKEVKIGLGRDFTKTLLGKKQVFMTSSTLRYLDIEPNGRDEVELVIDIRDYLSLFFDTNQELAQEDIDKLFDTLDIDLNTSDVVTIRGSDIINTTQLESKCKVHKMHMK